MCNVMQNNLSPHLIILLFNIAPRGIQSCFKSILMTSLPIQKKNVSGGDGHGKKPNNDNINIMEKELSFECKRGDMVAIYASRGEKRRFWVAEAATAIRKGPRENQMFSIFYYQATNPEYTTFEPENGYKLKSKVNYSQCICPLDVASRKDDSVVITPLVRDKITRIGLALDNESEEEEEEE